MPSVAAAQWTTVPDGEYSGLEYRIVDVSSKVINETNESITTKETTEIHIRGEEYNPNRKLAPYTPFNYSYWDEWEDNQQVTDKNVTTLTVIEYTTSVSSPEKKSGLGIVAWLNIAAFVLLLIMLLILRHTNNLETTTPASMAKQLLAAGHDEKYVHKVCEEMQRER